MQIFIASTRCCVVVIVQAGTRERLLDCFECSQTVTSSSRVHHNIFLQSAVCQHFSAEKRNGLAEKKKRHHY